MRVEHTFPALYDADSKILILGTMPSPKSRELGFYYGHPQNRFWKVMQALFDCELDTVQEKEDFCHHYHIALFDVLASCTIEGASDASIKNAVPNDLLPIFKTAEINAVFTTGKKAYDLYHRYQEEKTAVPAILLPSTSPANAVKTLDMLIEDYRIILNYL